MLFRLMMIKPEFTCIVYLWTDNVSESSRAKFHFIVIRASPGRILLPRSPGFLAQPAPVSKVMVLQGPVVRLMRGHVHAVLSGGDTRWAGASLSLQTFSNFYCYSRSSCSRATLDCARAIAVKQRQREKESRPAYESIALLPWALGWKKKSSRTDTS